MRTGRRYYATPWRLALLAILAGAAPSEPRPGPAGPSIRLAVEVDWSIAGEPSAAAGSTASMALSAGRIVAVEPWPPGSSPGGEAQAKADGSWSIGRGPKGRARALLEAPLGSELAVKVADRAIPVSLASVLDGPQRSAHPSAVEVGVERLPWDSIRADFGGDSLDGTAGPGALVPLSLAFNVLTPEAATVNLRCSAELRPSRGGEPVWRQEWQEIVATDAPEPRPHALSLIAPGAEGTYVLEVKTAWEPLADQAGSRLGRWLKRRRNPSQSTSASRRMTLAVLTPRPPAAPAPTKSEGGDGIEVDAFDLAKGAGHRPAAAGRAPLDPSGRRGWSVPEAALVDLAGRERFLGRIARAGPEPSALPPGDAGGLAWSAVGLRVAHPERPHRLTLTVVAGHPADLAVAVVAGGGPGGRGRVVLDASASGAPILEGGPPATFSWPVWPDSEGPSLVLVNRGESSPVQVGLVTLTELVDLPPAPSGRESGRALGLHLADLRALDRFGGGDAPGRGDPLAQGRNLASYLAHLGASAVVLPDGLADRASRRALEGQADEDATGPDRLDLLLRVLARRGCDAWVDVPFDAGLPGLPPADSPEAAARKLVRVDRRGGVDGPAAYQPIHPKVREAMARKVAEAVAIRRTRPNLLGALVRLGPGSTLPGGPDSGLDDASWARFVPSAFEPGPSRRVPGQGAEDPNRFDARARFVDAAGKLPWLGWRAREVASAYSGLAEAARRSAPGAALAVVTPGLEPGPAGEEALRVDLAGLGPSQAWRGSGLDLAAWPSGEGAPIVFRGAGVSTDDLGHDLATSPELDDLVAARPDRGSLIGVEAPDPPGRHPGPRLSARPLVEGPGGDEPLGHALAALDPRIILVASTAVAGHEERVRRFARAFAPLPAPEAAPPEPRLPSGVVARLHRSGSDTYLAMANDSPYPILLEAVLQGGAGASVDDLARGVRLDPERNQGAIRLVLELPPFGVSSARVSSAEVRVASMVPHASLAVLDGMKAHYDDLDATLKRLNRAPMLTPVPPAGPAPASTPADRGSGPANGGFEPESILLAGARSPASVAGWEVVGEGGGSIEVDRDRPHSGRGSLRFDGRLAPSAVASEPFRPEPRSPLTVRAWLRADRPDARARVRVEGLAAGRPYARQVEVPVRGDWSEVVLKVPKGPEGGFESARVRFELAGPGKLWVDDVAVRGDALTESERLNARRDLIAALSAYRAKRYADFARLAGSHWTRQVAAGSAAEAVAGDRSGLIRTGDASALPPGNRLR